LIHRRKINTLVDTSSQNKTTGTDRFCPYFIDTSLLLKPCKRWCSCITEIYCIKPLRGKEETVINVMRSFISIYKTLRAEKL